MNQYNSKDERKKALEALNTAADKAEKKLFAYAYKLAKYEPHTVNFIILKHRQQQTLARYNKIVLQISALEAMERSGK